MEYLKHKYTIPVILFFSTIVSRLPFTSKLLYDLDSVQFALGTNEYNITLHQPHPPGYIVYVMLGKLLNIFTHDANISFVIISIIFSALMVVIIYYLGMLLFTKEIGVLSALIALTSPSIWFHGEVSLGYIVEAFFCVLIALLCWKVLQGQHKYIYASAIFLALAGGVRQNTMVFLFPLWLFSIRNVPIRKILISALLFMAVVSIWLVPMIILSGGLANYRAAVNELWERVSDSRAIFKIGFLPVYVLHLLCLIKFTTYGLGIGVGFLGVHLYSIIRKGAWAYKFESLGSWLLDTKSIFFMVWLIPSVLFFMIVFIHPENVGYSLFFIPGLTILLANSLIRCSDICGKLILKGDHHSRVFVKSFAALIIISNALVFLLFPTHVSVSEIRNHEKNLQGVTSYVRDNFSPDDVVVFTDDLHYLGFRHAMYYLPDYKVFQTRLMGSYPEMGIFWGVNQHTYFSRNVRIPKGVKHCLILTHPSILKEQIMKMENILSPKEMELTALPDNPGVIKIDVNNAQEIYNNITFVFEG